MARAKRRHRRFDKAVSLYARPLAARRPVAVQPSPLANGRAKMSLAAPREMAQFSELYDVLLDELKRRRAEEI